MATNEIYKYGHWLTVPVPSDAVPGTPVVWGGAIPGVVQALFKPELPEVAGYIRVPNVPNGNESGEAIDEALLPDDSVFGSVAFVGVWAFDLGDASAAAIGDPVYFTAGSGATPGTLSLAAGGADGIYGHVHNLDYNGNVHVRLAATLLPSA